MVDELLYREPVSFTMLCTIAEKNLKKKIRYMCVADEWLRGRGYEWDILQEVQLRLMKTTVTHFLLKDGPDGPLNNDPEGFMSWMNTVAVNIKKDFSNKVRKNDFHTTDPDNPMIEKELIEKEPDFYEEKLDLLKWAFGVVLSSDVSIYKILTWLAQFSFIVDTGISKIESNEKIIEEFEQKTLFEMYDMVLKMSYKIEWIEISPAQDRKILEALNRPLDEKLTYGDVKYNEFFMKVNGKKSGKKSISDWVNRMNGIIRKEYNKNTEKRRGFDESSYS